MMIQEFEKLTGMEVNQAEYAVIEQMYYEFDGDKTAFCKKFVRENGLVKVLRELAEGYEGTALSLEAQLKAERKHFETYSRDMISAVEKLKKQLEKEQEWKPWVPEKAVSQKDYDHLKSCGENVMTDGKAIEWIAQEWGFAADKIRINRKMKQYEVNRHHQLRTVGEIDREPRYEATDWYYVFFTVCGMEYEDYNGTLIQL